MEFFIDRDLGAEIFPKILREAGLAVHRHIDHFPANAPDTIWLPAIAKRGWIILSNDLAILRNPLEREAVMVSGAALLVLIGGDAPTEQLARNFVNTLPRIKHFLDEHSPPFIAKIYRPNPIVTIFQGKPGRIEMKLTETEWRSLQRRMR